MDSSSSSMDTRKRAATEVEEAFNDEASSDGRRDSDVCSSAKRRRKLNPMVWKHFTRTGESQVQCNHCKQKYLHKTSTHGTTSLNRHVRDICPKKPLFKSMDMISKNAEGKTQFRQYVQKIAEEKFIKFLIPLEDMRDWAKVLNPECIFHSRRSDKYGVLWQYETNKARVKSELQRIPSRISLSSNCWTGASGEGFFCLVAHYVDEQWKLNSKLLSLTDMPPPHTCEALATKIHDCLKDWGIENKVFTITLDKSSANDTLQEILKERLCLDNILLCDGNLFHVRCYAHVLNIIVKDALNVLGDVVSKIRDSVKYVKGSKGRMMAFERCIELEGGNGKGIILSTDTFVMLDKARKYQRAFNRYEMVDQAYKHCPSIEEWVRVDKICDLLEPFDKVSSSMSDSSYSTSNMFYVLVWKIGCLLRENATSDDVFIRNMASSMLEEFNKYWEKYSIILVIGAILDPRMKCHIVKHSLHELDPSTSEDRLEYVKKSMSVLFEAYKNNSKSLGMMNIDGSASSQIGIASQQSQNSSSLDDFYFYGFDDDEEEEDRRSLLDIYLDERKLRLVDYRNMDVLNYWKENRQRYRELSCMACDVLSIPLTTVDSGSSFTVESHISNKYKNRLLTSEVQALICLRSWMKGFKDENQVAEGEEVIVP